MSEVMQPKWFADTKRGIGMLMVGLGTFIPLVAGYFGVTIDTATWGQFAANVASWFDVTWNVIGYVLWIWGTFRPTAPIAVMKPV